LDRSLVVIGDEFLDQAMAHSVIIRKCR
jgi:hypothetical protein